MDVYSSLLNLNFMTSLRTGNLIVDMLIAVLIPVISGMIHQFFRHTWPGLVRRVLTVFSRTGSTTMIQPPIYDTYGNVSLDVCENAVLSEAITQYVARKVKPSYEKGAYRYKRPPGVASEDRGATLADVLQKCYCVQTVPAEDCSVPVGSSLDFSLVADNNAGGEDGGGGEGGGGGDGGGGGGRGGKSGPRAKNRTKAISLVTKQTGVLSKDVAAAFVGDAWEWYKNSLQDTTDRSRYLLQPLVEKAASGNELMRCQFFPLSQEKTFNTLFFPEKQRLINLIDQFQAQTGKFAIPGFPHKLVLLLYGPPGTGKTSLVKAIAAYTGRNLFSIPLSRVQTNRQLLQYMFDMRCRLPGTRRNRYSSDQSMKLPAKKVIYVLEDIDAASGVLLRDSWKDVAVAADEARPGDVAKDDGAEDGDEKSSEKEDEKKSDASSSHDGDGEEEKDDEEEAEASEKATKKKKTVTVQDPKDEDADTEEGEDEDEDEDDDDSDDGSSSSSKSEEKKKAKKKKQHDKVAINDLSKTDKLSMQGVLVALNGILNAPGRIVVMTTNHIEHLDPALTRPGVVTMKLHMSHFSPECAVEMVQHYFNSTSETGQVPQSQLDAIYKEVELRRGRAFSPAEVEQLCAENDSVEGVIQALRKGSGRDIF